MSSELAVVYAALILHDDGIEITSEKLTTVIKAAGLEIEPIWANIFAKALEGKNVADYIKNITSGCAAPAAASAAAPAAAAKGADKKEEKKKEEVKEESDEEMGFGLFD